MVCASGVSSSHKKKFFSETRISTSDHNQLRNRINLLLQEKQAVKNSNILNEEVIAIADKLLDYQRISRKQHKFLLVISFN